MYHGKKTKSYNLNSEQEFPNIKEFTRALPKSSMKIDFKSAIAFTLLFGLSCEWVGAQTTQTKEDTLNNDFQIQEVQINATLKKGTENRLINLQKNSLEVVENIGSSQLEKQGVGNAALAVSKASGTQKQEGSGQIVVRGLGDRFNTTTLNGLPIPSDDPEYKNINLEVFKTAIIEYISLSKVYNPSISGDFGGANINIVSKEFEGKPYVKLSVGSDINLQTIGKKNFKLQDGSPGFFGYKISSFTKGNPDQYPFTTNWNFSDAKMPLGSQLSLEAGKRFNKFSVFTYAGYSNNYVYSKGFEGFYNATGNAIKALDVERYTYSTNTTALVNLLYKPSTKNRIGFTSNFIHASEQDARFFDGFLREIGTNVRINRGDNKITSVLINQLYGQHRLSETWDANWGIGYNILKSNRPDRLQNTFDGDTFYLITGSVINNSRYFDDLNDNTLAGFAHFTKQLNNNLKLEVGYNGSYKDRNFENTTIGLNFSKQTPVDPNNVDAFINPQNNNIISYSTFRTSSNFFEPFYYQFKQMEQSGFVNINYVLNDNLTAQLGGRFDYISTKTEWDDVISGLGNIDKKYYKFLPAINLKYNIQGTQNIRLSVSKTYTLPQPKELVPIAYYDVTTNVYGNPNLIPSDNYNIDLKWELFPASGEIFSITTFGKYIVNPIARTNYSTAASSDMTYFNIANHGYIFGIESEIRKDLYKGQNSRLYTFLNLTWMHSQQKLKSEAELAKENEGKLITFSGSNSERIQGVADFLANFNIGYQKEINENQHLDFTISYSYMGKSLFSLGTSGIGNFYEMPLHQLNANIKYSLRKIDIGLNFQNLLNPKYKIEESLKSGDYTQSSYTKGVGAGIQLTYKF